jgi:hypothetical protein
MCRPTSSIEKLDTFILGPLGSEAVSFANPKNVKRACADLQEKTIDVPFQLLWIVHP